MLKYGCHLLAFAIVLLLLANGCGTADKKEEQARPENAETESTDPDKLTIYYFHTTHRCWTCTQFEKLTKELLSEDFSAKISSGVLDFRSINVEEEQHKHFIQDYRLVTKSLIVSLEGGGKELAWKNLDQVWTLARDATKFKNYVRTAINEYLGRIG